MTIHVQNAPAPEAHLRPAFDYETLHPLGVLSRWWSDRLIVRHLVPGSWLDLLSGPRAMLQIGQLDNPKINAFFALDHSLDAGLVRTRFLPVRCVVRNALPFQDGTIDNITIINGLEHCWSPQEVVSECFRILRVGGVMQIVVPTWFAKPILEFLAFRIKNRQAELEMNDHKMYYDERDVWPLVVRSGFKPKHIRMSRIKAHCSLYVHAVKEHG